MQAETVQWETEVSAKRYNLQRLCFRQVQIIASFMYQPKEPVPAKKIRKMYRTKKCRRYRY